MPTGVVDETTINSNGNIIAKVNTQGDTRTCQVTQGTGIEANPAKSEVLDLTYLTANGGRILASGGFNQNIPTEAQSGERRIYSTNADGDELQAVIFWRNDGTLEINGTDDNAVRYQPLADAFNDLLDKYNQLVQLFNSFTTAYTSHVHTVAGGGTGPPNPTFAQTGEQSTADIAAAKIDDITTS